MPIIFSLAEDALFSVPATLSQGSLALGAAMADGDQSGAAFRQRWHFLRADDRLWPRGGGNHDRADGYRQHADYRRQPVPGLRALAANIAIEMPEAVSGSSHYRVLFLTALVLFVFTFVFNTLAEAVRLRLRKRYTPNQEAP